MVKKQEMSLMNLMKDTVCLQLRFSRPGDKTRADKEKIEVDADKAMLHFTKSLLDSKELKMVSNHRQNVRMYVQSLAIPSPIFRYGIHNVPIGLIEQIETKLETAKVEDEKLVKVFLTAYNKDDGLIAQAKKRLKKLFNEADYPTTAKMKESFSFDWSYFTFQTPDSLNSISSELFKKEKAKMEQKWQEAQQEIVVLLRAEFKGLVDHMVERLTPDEEAEEDSRKKFFKGATITNVSDFLGTFPFRNVCNDKELDSLVDKAKKLLDGIDPKEVRKDESIKSDLQKNFKVVKKELDKLVKVKPKRMISFDEEG